MTVGPRLLEEAGKKEKGHQLGRFGPKGEKKRGKENGTAGKKGKGKGNRMGGPVRGKKGK